MLKIHTATAGVLAGALLLTGCSSSVRAPKPGPSASSSTSVSASPSVSATPSSSPTPSASATPSESPTPTVTPSPVPTTEAPVQVPAAEAPSAEAPAAPVSAAPAQQAPAQPVQQAPAQSSVYYKNCDAVRAAGAAPLHRGEPGYRPGLDSDGDGVACEPKKKH
ncbi:calcium-binding protein [Rothia sp. HMSC066G07]|uniref:excalibur calcium-binding domain-containing protein n=1 Tax=Rothia sp. HMSC066G07 TaxID=1739475 RepID=UPI0008B71246|nr:excalibur calcium-binding domain-containing protein [Rothia sp. HMSC066G07]OFP77577.1 calcium-binding protein [Rothia sp. HMSC066G07]